MKKNKGKKLGAQTKVKPLGNVPSMKYNTTFSRITRSKTNNSTVVNSTATL